MKYVNLINQKLVFIFGHSKQERLIHIELASLHQVVVDVPDLN